MDYQIIDFKVENQGTHCNVPTVYIKVPGRTKFDFMREFFKCPMRDYTRYDDSDKTLNTYYYAHVTDGLATYGFIQHGKFWSSRTAVINQQMCLDLIEATFEIVDDSKYSNRVAAALTVEKCNELIEKYLPDQYKVVKKDIYDEMTNVVELISDDV